MLYNFANAAPKGANPYAGVIRDSSGNLYGTTSGGGTSGAGVVYGVDTAGQERVLYSFTGGADGGSPFAGVIRDSAGNLYGTTSGGGTSGQGVVFKLSTAGQETVLYSFTGGADGGYPNAGVIRDSAGNLYSTTAYGGAPYYGVVFKVNTAGQETVLYSFTGGANGGYPFAGVVSDPAGNLYGTTTFGGPVPPQFPGYTGPVTNGTVFKVDTAGQETVLYTFPPPADGTFPYAGVIRDSAGNLYGTTSAGGPANAGVVYKLDTAGRETVLYAFTGGADGAYPQAGVILDSAGNLYGTTPNGGSGEGSAGYGVVYKLDTAGQETVLYTFTGGADGGYPYAGVIRDSAGNLYGTTNGALPYGGGTSGYGVVYKLDTAGQLTVLYSFTGGADGGQPYGAGVIRDSDGNLYGTTEFGGACCGVVFEVDTAGQETVLYSFPPGVGAPPAGGAYPGSGVIRGSAGNLYGITLDGGTSANAGVVYKLDTAGQETVLYAFTGGADGGEQSCCGYFGAGVILDSAGNIYGTTYEGGDSSGGCRYVAYVVGCGVVFKLNPSGQETVLYTFTGGADGGNPYAGVIGDSAGNLYGSTYYGGKNNTGVVFKLKPQ